MKHPITGELPANPLGKCFDTVGHQFMELGTSKFWTDIIVVHALCVANFPGDAGEGEPCAHAWIEAYHTGRKVRVVIDTTWNKFFEIKAYRERGQTSLVIEYKPEQFLINWWRTGVPGPWDQRLMPYLKGRKVLKQ